MRSKWHFTLLKNFLDAFAVLILWNLGSTTLVRADDCRPGADEIALFRDENFRGPCVVKGIGEYPVLRNIGFLGVSSIRVGANVEALVCRPGMTRCSFAYQDLATLENTRNQDSGRSFIVRRKNQPPECRPSDDQVALWEYEYWFGRCQLVSVGSYPRDPSGARPPIDPLSLKVGSNVSVSLCSKNTFEGDCLTLLPGYYRYWNYHRTGTIIHGHIVRSIAVRPKNQRLACVPNANQVAVYQFERYFGPCRVFDIGDYSLNEALSWAAGLQRWEVVARSFRVGANVQATLCWGETHGGQGFRICARSLRINVSGGFRHLMPSEQVSLTVQQRGATAPTGDNRSRPEGGAPPAVSAHDFTVSLSPNVPHSGFPWWTGRYPTIGTLDGNLTRVANPRNSVWLGFLKSGYGSVDCGNADAYVLLRPGETMTEDQLSTIFRSRSPALPVQFVVCSGAVGQPTARGGLSFPALRLNITYTRRR